MNKPELLGLRYCTWVWLILLTLTLVTWLMGTMGLTGLPLSLTVLGLALFKGHLVGDYFMELKRVRGFWRWPVTLWLMMPGGLVATAFVLAAR